MQMKDDEKKLLVKNGQGVYHAMTRSELFSTCEYAGVSAGDHLGTVTSCTHIRT